MAMLAVALGACVVGGPDEDEASERRSLTPTYSPDTTVTSTAGGAGSPTSSAPTAESPGGAAPSAPPIEPQPPVAPSAAQTSPVRVAISDPVGDLTASPLDRPPGWADLVGAVLTRTPGGFELRVTMAQAVPSGAPDEDHTMNVAAFFDVDGDGSVDTEVWANLASGGWGGAWFDDDSGDARFVDESGVAVTVEGGALVVRFGAGHIRGAESFRWSLASEWGRYAVIGTPSAARDDAPDGDRPVAFP